MKCVLGLPGVQDMIFFILIIVILNMALGFALAVYLHRCEQAAMSINVDDLKSTQPKTYSMTDEVEPDAASQSHPALEIKI